MAKIHGQRGIVKIAGTDNVAEMQSWNIDVQAEVLVGTAMGTVWGDSETGIKTWSGSFEAYFDPTDAAQILLDAGDNVDIMVYPGGETAGEPTKSGTVTITGTPLSASKDGWVSLTVNFTGKGALVTGVAP